MTKPKEPTREDMEACLTFWISRCRGRSDSRKLACASLCTKDAIEQCKKAEKAIRRLIEKAELGVDEDFVEDFCKELEKCLSVGSVPEHEDRYWGELDKESAIKIIKKRFYAAGVRVKDKKGGRR